ncbi:hypothetical protein [Pseudomonas sp. FP1740]|uniref:hypothetical protein n=1 Tax=Pseudomonas sp. FP1740 TaxID=2954078 RepID=UPI002736F1A5|nr:hypothetical protein [Pseudomonas sp. FP1740]WLG46392.1 hypothetical protein PSH69_07155 [Pseudomonas sp. FP1740]
MKSNLKAAAYAAQSRFCYAHGAGHTSASAGTPQEKGQKQKHCKSKNQHRFSQKERRKEEHRDRCFSVALKYKDPLLKNFFKGPSEKIFFLTQHRSKARRFGDTCELQPEIFQRI